MKTLLSTLKPEFTFAGFSFPKHVWTLPRGSMARRLAARKPVVCGNYYHCPKPNSNAGVGFYLASDGAPALRWQWADEVIDLGHNGWYSDEFGDSELVRGVVFRLPRGRGFLAGWSMGEGMASSLDLYVYGDERSAAFAADSMAECASEAEREYQAAQEESRQLTEFLETLPRGAGHWSYGEHEEFARCDVSGMHGDCTRADYLVQYSRKGV